MTPPDTEHQDKLQHHRLRMTLLSLVNFTLQSIILALYAWEGSVPWPVVGLFFVVGSGQAAVFALVIWRRWSLRFKDPGLLMPQIVASMAVLLGFVALAPQVWVLFLLAVMVAYNFVMITFSARQFTVAWLLVGAGSAVVLYAARGQLGHVGASHTSVAILWLFFFLIIRQLSAIGRQFSSLRNRLSQQNQRLAESLQRIQQLASHDDLTGVLNRRAFMQALSDERARALRTAHPFCVSLIDIDHFKAVNDRYGHLTGDAVLKEFCIAATSSIRTTDRLARFGGEEFILLLVPVMGAEAGFIAAERVRLAVETYEWGRIAPDLKLTVSAGVAAYAPGDTVESLIARADRALYAAKDAGRNRTVAG